MPYFVAQVNIKILQDAQLEALIEAPNESSAELMTRQIVIANQPPGFHSFVSIPLTKVDNPSLDYPWDYTYLSG